MQGGVLYQAGYHDHTHLLLSQTNTFQGVFATGTLKNKTQSYAIFLYGRLEWLDENAAIGVIDGRGRPLFVFGPTQSVLENLIQAPPSGVLVAALDKYWYQESTTTQNAMGQGDTSKLAAYSAKLRKPLEVLQQSIDLYLKWFSTVQCHAIASHSFMDATNVDANVKL